MYWRRAAGTGAPTTIQLDGTDVTASATTVNDAAIGFAVSTIQLSQPLAAGSMHIFQGTYADGKTAGAGVRAWSNPFVYGQWSAMPTVPEDDPTATAATVDDATNRGVNAMVVQGETVHQPFRRNRLRPAIPRRPRFTALSWIRTVPGRSPAPWMWFIRDEPDAADYRVTDIPSGKMVGSLAQMAVQTGETLRARNPAVPTTLNLDGTYKPFNWYNYGQVPDVMMVDAYYEPQLKDAIWTNTSEIPLYSKVTFDTPSPRWPSPPPSPIRCNCILYSCQYIDKTNSRTFPFAAPASKRIELYYALAAGAKGFSYWWFKPASSAADGLADGGTAALALWKEIGLLGNEIRNHIPVPGDQLPGRADDSAEHRGLGPGRSWRGSDTVILLAVNDQYYNDQSGCHYTPVANASVAVTLPTWIASPTAFEVSAGGIRDVSTQAGGGQLQVSLGTLDVTRMIVITLQRLAAQHHRDAVQRAGSGRKCVPSPRMSARFRARPSASSPPHRASAPDRPRPSPSRPRVPARSVIKWQKNSTSITKRRALTRAARPPR